MENFYQILKTHQHILKLYRNLLFRNNIEQLELSTLNFSYIFLLINLFSVQPHQNFYPQLGILIEQVHRLKVLKLQMFDYSSDKVLLKYFCYRFLDWEF